jgi:hypothetical protein
MTGSGGATGGGGRGGAGGTTTSTGTGGKGAGGTGNGGVGGRDAGADGTTSAGGTSGRDAGTGGSGAVYQPCPSDGSPCKILPFGDSITYGVNDEGNAGYRGPLFASAAAAGQKITFTGSLSDGPSTVSGQTFPKNNEGHSGWGISEVNPNSGGNAGIATVIPGPALNGASGGVPNIILLHSGAEHANEPKESHTTTTCLARIILAISSALDDRQAQCP